MRSSKKTSHVHTDGCADECRGIDFNGIDLNDIEDWISNLKSIHVHLICESLNDILLNLGFRKQTVSSCVCNNRCQITKYPDPLSHEYVYIAHSESTLDSVLMGALYRPTLGLTSPREMTTLFTP
eukprot:GHVO01029041.1.p1 GENE.GHVO01029041.1~~GHVO01029041.1.p1  ORF type:complete len:125 (+),score=6.78 GHVO01029041.1:168-542(+)